MSASRASKRFGQHFLTSSPTITRIIELIAPHPDQTIIEIGPGRGALTVPLAQSGADLLAIEFDRDLIEPLQKKLSDYANIRVVQSDILEYTPPESVETITLVGNLPYNITSPVIEWVVAHRDRIHRAVFMVQQEMAQRLASEPNSKDWAPIALFTQLHFQIHNRFAVKPEAFTPPPKVTSSVIELTRHANPVKVAHPRAFECVVRAAFAHRRKQLINNLVPEIVELPEALRSLLREIGLDETVRAEQMSTEHFLDLTEHLVARTMLKDIQGQQEM
ncbi:ribosomal RNA small subunit methyltransferase A [candidate division GN15 bacterium]|nr:ribosomal RNA small subunit methyltransferase A [candidate division GN15 bacterium]